MDRAIKIKSTGRFEKNRVICIQADDYWDQIESKIERGTEIVIDDAYEDIELFRKTTLQHYDHCRNALLVLLDGDMDAVIDAYIAALHARVDGKWAY